MKEPVGRLRAASDGDAHGRRKRREYVETALIVALAALVLIKGSGAIGDVIAGIGQMFMAIFRW